MVKRVKHSLSLVIITFNEERNIERCIRSVPFASDVVVVDSGSQDRTLEIARSLGARIYQQPWLGYGPQKRFATSKAEYDWVLSLDADEVLSEDLAREIQNRWAELDATVGYEMPRKTFHLGRWILRGGWYPDRQLRLYNRKFSNWPEMKIHERVQAPRTEPLQSPILHYVFSDLSEQIGTNNRYSSLLAEKDFLEGKRFSLWKLILKPWAKFVESYFLKFGFLDGLPGFVIAVGAGYSIFLRWSKLWELEMKKRQGPQK